MSAFWFSARDCVTLLLVIWAAAIATFVESNTVARLLWIPISLGLIGVLGSLVILAIPSNVILEANVATLVLFVISFEVLKRKRHSSVVQIKPRF
jgi:hypothetical protein